MSSGPFLSLLPHGPHLFHCGFFSDLPSFRSLPSSSACLFGLVSPIKFDIWMLFRRFGLLVCSFKKKTVDVRAAESKSRQVDRGYQLVILDGVHPGFHEPD